MLRLIIGTFLGIVIGIFLGIGISYIMDITNSEKLPEDYVSVKVINKSDSTINILDLVHKKGSVTIRRMFPNELYYFYFKPGGENVFNMEAHCNSKKRMMLSRSFYVEYADRFNASILKDTIIIERDHKSVL